MSFDPARVSASFAFDPDTFAGLRRDWLTLLDLSVFGEVKSSKIGAIDRLRRRLLEIGEGLRSLTNDRRWIPQPREQIKGAMGASLKLRDTLLGLERAAQVVDGGNDFPHFEHALLDFRQRLLQLIEHHEALWTTLLEEQYDEAANQDDEDD
ncbi:hypothetical protein BI364_13225 [Acidihalobacter yilgarnensis]|uniref:CHAD domain-containing protein n=1 Tax=Acidihalobacter yilgarnensis TaxID=2819280 RepID=A0A1D8IQL2_9GAMM|nr:hypothetical protein [Acidihalobacter yilgarnensis]AOU98798.1 hypothetical protein BI364_13225 [Acidihalobacter yilgarnensis]